MQDIEEETIEDKEGRVMTLFQETIEEARQEARKEARKEWWQKGQQEERQKVALNFLSVGLDLETVSKCTGLSQEEIKKLKNSS